MSTTKKKTFLKMTSLLAACLLLSACAQTEPAEQLTFPEEAFTTPAEANYETVQVEEGSFVTTVSGKLSVAYLLEAELSWEQSGARFREVFVKKNQEVKEGDILMTFDVESSSADLTELRLQRQRKWEDYLAGKEERLAAIEAAKAQAQGLTSYELQIANLKIEKMQAQYEQYVFETTRSVYAIDDRILEMEDKTKDTVLVAPFDGVIDSVVSFFTGDPVTPGKVLITMYSTDTLLLQAKDDSGKLRYNLPVTIESGSKTSLTYFSGRVVTSPNILPTTISSDLILVELDEDITQDDLSNYLTYRVDNEVVEGILVVPKRAVQREDGKSYVYVLEGDIIQKKYVVIRSNSTATVWVQEGLSAGQTLIVD